MPGAFEQRWRATLARKADATALVCAATGHETTFAGLDASARALAKNFPADLDLRRRLILLHLPNSPAWPVAFLALHRAGATVIPVDAETPPAAVAALTLRLRVAAVYDTTGLRATAGATARVAPAGIFLGKLTSGTTGVPQLFLFTEAQMLADADAVTGAMGVREGDINHAGLPFAHAYALGNLILPLFAHGLPSVIAGSHFPGVVAAEIERHRATILPTVPALVAALHRSDIPPARLASLRIVVSAGARLAPADALAFAAKFGRRVHNLYGSSETGAIAYDTTGDGPENGHLGSPLPLVSVSRTQAGRLRASGPAVFTAGNRSRAGDLGAHTLADLGALDADGHLVLTGRHTTLIKVGGRRVSPAEVEAALRALPGIADAHVVEIADTNDEPRLAALIVGEARDSRTLRAALRASLPAWKIPSRIVFSESLPTTPRGKPDRAAILARLTEA